MPTTTDHQAPERKKPAFGALVISLDFELHWGVRDTYKTQSAYRSNLLGARSAVPAILSLFKQFGIRATWATVGMLFARDRHHWKLHSPPIHPCYRDRKLNPYRENLGENEADDPLHFAPSLIRAIEDTPGQEIASHTFSHFYCLAEGQTSSDFALDLESAIRIARESGIDLRSLVFPRNQYNAEYLGVLKSSGLLAYRGNAPGWMYAARYELERSWYSRAARLIDSYIPLSGHGGLLWPEPDQYGLYNVAGSCFLRPYTPWLNALEPLRLRRLKNSLAHAARNNRVWHLWWHPHNFGIDQSANLTFLEEILHAFAKLRDSHGMQSLTMLDVANFGLQGATEMNSLAEAI